MLLFASNLKFKSCRQRRKNIDELPLRFVDRFSWNIVLMVQARQRRQQIDEEMMKNETKEERLARLEREKVREDRRRDREREHRLENRGAAAKAAAKKGQKSGPPRQRDITERIALGEVVPRSQVLRSLPLFKSNS